MRPETLLGRRQFLAAAFSYPLIPKGYLDEAEAIPDFWISTVDGVTRFLESRVRKGQVQQTGTTAGGRPVRAVFYGTARAAKGATTFSGSLGAGDVSVYYGADFGRKVYLGMAGVHGGEFEGIVGAVNLLSVLETGQDLRGKAWPELTRSAAALDRIVVIPVVNVDGRTRVPLRMEKARPEETVAEYFNTGGWPDGRNIGWPDCKRFIPLDFSKTSFPGGYPNDAGVNLIHDDFFGSPQPETRMLMALAARERPDLILNLHTGATWPHALRPFTEPVLQPVFERFYARLQGRLAVEGLQKTRDPKVEGNAKRESLNPYNLDTALNLHCGALSVVVESPSHGIQCVKDAQGRPAAHKPEALLDMQMICHQEAMGYLAAEGGRSRWASKR